MRGTSELKMKSMEREERKCGSLFRSDEPYVGHFEVGPPAAELCRVASNSSVKKLHLKESFKTFLKWLVGENWPRPNERKEWGGKIKRQQSKS